MDRLDCCAGAYYSDKIFEQFGKKIGVVAALAMAVAIACFVFENIVLSVAMIIIFPVVGFVSDQIGLGKSLLGIGFVLIGFTLLWRKKMVA